MRLKLAALFGVIAMASCAKPPVSSGPPAPPDAFKLWSGELRDFANYGSICVKATDLEAGVNLTPVAVSVLSSELPGFFNSCATTATLEASLDTGHSATLHSTVRGPRYGFGHVGRRGSGSSGPLVAEAMVWDRHVASDNREEAVRRAATSLANFLKSARATAQPSGAHLKVAYATDGARDPEPDP